MNVFNKKLIIAAAGALILFATGCTKKAVRPTPDQTVIGDGSAYTTTETTGATTSGNTTSTFSNSGASGSYDAGSGFGTTTSTMTTTAQDTLSSRTDGTLSGNELRNISSLQSIYFDFDRSAVRASEYAKVQAVKDYLAKNPQYKVLFEGHCDWRGTSEYNMSLGDRRASAVRKYAISLGIDPSKVQTKSVGSFGAKERGSEADMAQDRRAEIVILVK